MSTGLSNRALALAILVLAVSSCSGKVVPAGGLFLVICTDGTLRPDVLHLLVQSSDLSREYRKEDIDIGPRARLALPASLAIASNGNAAASVVIDVSISKGGTELGARHYEVSRMPADRITQLDVVFTASCSSPSCARTDVRGDMLPAYSGTSAQCHPPADGGEPMMEAGGAPDASVDADARMSDVVPPSDRSSDGGSDGATADAGNDADAPIEVDAGPLCTPTAERCVGNAPQVCDATGHWAIAPACVQGVTHCSGIRCVPVPPSCSGGSPGAGFDCSSAGNGDCCASYDVVGGEFFRDFDGEGNTDDTHPATVSSFRLDAYEITVGRFRQFVGAVIDGWRPRAGDGKHARLHQGNGLAGLSDDAGAETFETGWDESWTTNLPANAVDWDAKLFCFSGDTATWTPNRGIANERLPLTCVDWYAAYAFCIWDGGFLPSTAEWNYAAAGGAEHRVYAWGKQAPERDTALAIWGCQYGGGNCMGLVNVAPVGSARGGDGRWGQSDLTGSVWEWVLDYQAPYFEPCTDCAATTGVGHVLRGGAFNNYVADLVISHHLWSRSAHTNVGARCARVIP